MLITLLAAALGMMPQPVVPLRSDFTSHPSLVDLDVISGARIALTVDADGVPRHCDVVAPSGAGRLDRVGCALLLKGSRFRPARDEAGVPVAAVVEHGIAINGGVPRPHDVDFALPVSRLLGRPTAVADARVVVEPDGRISSCAIAASTGTPALDRLVCAGIAGETLPVARTAAGAPLRAMRLVSVGFAVGEIGRQID